MPQVTQTVSAGTDFDGTSGQGEVLLTDGLSQEDDTQRAELLNIGVNSDQANKMDSLVIRLAPSTADADPTTGALFLELANFSDAGEVQGGSLACCRCIVPRGWNLYVFSSGGAGDRKLMADWQRVTLGSRA